MVSIKAISFTDRVTSKTVAINIDDVVEFDYQQPLSEGTKRSGKITNIRIVSPTDKPNTKYRRNDNNFKRGSILITLDANRSYYIDRAALMSVKHVF